MNETILIGTHDYSFIKRYMKFILYLAYFSLELAQQIKYNQMFPPLWPNLLLDNFSAWSVGCCQAFDLQQIELSIMPLHATWPATDMCHMPHPIQNLGNKKQDHQMAMLKRTFSYSWAPARLSVRLAAPQRNGGGEAGESEGKRVLHAAKLLLAPFHNSSPCLCCMKLTRCVCRQRLERILGDLMGGLYMAQCILGPRFITESGGIRVFFQLPEISRKPLWNS